MSNPVAVDLAPLGHLLLVGAMLAGLALGVAWLRRRNQAHWSWQHGITVLTLVLTFDLVLFGAFTRLSDSGLGCPDWPGCYGNASPLGAAAEISAAQAAMPSGPVTHGKAWIEMVHRYLASGVGALILVLAVASWRERSPGPGGWLARWWPTLTLVWVCVQGAFGAWTVTLKLRPAIVTLHLLGGLALLAMLCVQVERQARRGSGNQPVALDAGSAWLLRGTALLLVVQLALGGWVSTNYAVLACTDFPTCQNSWWPPMRFDQGFELWRDLGMTSAGEPVSFAALTAIHYAHRLMAAPVLLALVVLALRLRAVGPLRRHAHGIAALAALQLATGLGNVILGWPMLAALLHTGGAAALVVVLTSALARSSAPTLARGRVPLPAARGAKAVR